MSWCTPFFILYSCTPTQSEVARECVFGGSLYVVETEKVNMTSGLPRRLSDREGADARDARLRK